MRYFKSSIYFSLICLCIAGFIGYQSTHNFDGVLTTIFICSVLGIMEISLSFDNAVINATTLQTMDAIWQRRFMTWGMIIAVFGMRLVFPLLIVGIAARIGPLSVLELAVTHPQQYATILTGAHTGIMGFGGTFLGLVGLNFFFNKEKNVHWIHIIEQQLQRLSKIESIEITLILIFVILISKMIPTDQALVFISASIFGIITYIAIQAVNHLLNQNKTHSSFSTNVKTGLGGFLYLELLDASFSFDGVVGAFALSTNLFIIAIGLGIGAMFVRSLTLMLVEHQSLSKYRYLEHGAFWAILALSAIMFMSVYKEIPEAITGLIGITFIILAFISSIQWNRSQPDQS